MRIIARRFYETRRPDGATRIVKLAIEEPVRQPTGEWACQIHGVRPGRRGYPAICGVDSFQALELAMKLLTHEIEWLQNICGDGLTLLDDEGQEAVSAPATE